MMRMKAWVLLGAAAWLTWSGAANAQRGQPATNARQQAVRANPDALRIVTEAERALRTPPLQVSDAQLLLFRTQTVQQYLSSSTFNLINAALTYSLDRQPAGGYLAVSGLPISLSPQTDHAMTFDSETPIKIVLGLPLAAQGLHLVECRFQGMDQANWSLMKSNQWYAGATITHQNGVHLFVVDIPAGGIGSPRLIVEPFRSPGSVYPLRSFERCEVRKIEQ